MHDKYVIGIDQSTQGSKALLFSDTGKLLMRCDLPHKQLVNEDGWVSHDGDEIYSNVIKLIHVLIEKTGIPKESVTCVGISNQRETSIAWDASGKPLAPAIVWQCARAESVIRDIKANENFKNSRQENQGSYAEFITEFVRKRTGIPLSPYFPAAKIAWLMQNEPMVKKEFENGTLHVGTMDSYLLYRLTGGKAYKTDYSNASRTQLFNITSLSWDKEVCELFGIPVELLPKVVDSNDEFGETDFEGYFEKKVPILAMMGDSHGALFGQGCLSKGMVKTTYGTGSSIMMNVGTEAIISKNGLVTSLAWGIDGEVNYVLEGNLNYTGAVMTWLKEDLNMIRSSAQTGRTAKRANPADTTYLVPAFSGLGAPYWKSDAKAILYGMTRKTGKAEIVKAALDCIAYQIADIVFAMQGDSGIAISTLRVDGGPTKNSYLMQFQSDILEKEVQVSEMEELSGFGAAYLAGCKQGIYKMSGLHKDRKVTAYTSKMDEEIRRVKYAGWLEAVSKV